MDDAIQGEILQLLTELVIERAPDATFRSMYGGTVIEMTQDDPKSQIGGFFAYAGYVSFEFSKGALLDDPQGVLEGKGKHRRHIKLRKPDDIAAQGCAGFLQQTLEAN
jgi:hypothetical protein